MSQPYDIITFDKLSPGQVRAAKRIEHLIESLEAGPWCHIGATFLKMDDTLDCLLLWKELLTLEVKMIRDAKTPGASATIAPYQSLLGKIQKKLKIKTGFG